ncbi:hypothetical protein EJB05_46401, partial [Eragrostis curvula]
MAPLVLEADWSTCVRVPTPEYTIEIQPKVNMCQAKASFNFSRQKEGGKRRRDQQSCREEELDQAFIKGTWMFSIVGTYVLVNNEEAHRMTS